MTNEAGHEALGAVLTEMHLDLSDAAPGEEYWVHAMGRRQDLAVHTPETRATARACWPLLAAVPDARLTHFVARPPALPRDRAGRIHVKHTLRTFPWAAKGAHGVGNAAIYVPPKEPLRPSAAPSGAQHVMYIDYVATARTLVFHHPDLICTDAAASQTVYGYMDGDKAISLQCELLGGMMRDMGPPRATTGWALLKPFTPPAIPGTKIDGTKTYYEVSPADAVILAAGDVMTAMMKATKNDATLKGKKWTQETGICVLPAAPPGAAGLGDDDWTPALHSTDTVDGLTASITVLDAAKTQLQLTLTNNYIRYLGAYIQFLDASGAVMSVPDWKPDGDQDLLVELGIQYDTIRYIGHIGPQNNVMAIPFPPAGALTVGLTFPPRAASAVIWGSGLGTGANPDPKTPIPGGVLTGLMNLAIPSFMLAAGTAATAFGPAITIVEKLLKNMPFITSVVMPIVQMFTTFGSNGEMKMNWGAFTSLFRALFNKAAAELLIWVEAQMVTEELADEIPFAGWIMVAINIAVGVAQLAETIIEVCMSSWNIENAISITITTAVSVRPDPRHGVFPQPGPADPAHYRAKMIYKDQARPSVADPHDVPAQFTGTTLPASFPGNTLGGQVKFEADYYVGSWLAAKATTGWMKNDAASVSTVELVLVQFPVPLTSESVYRHAALLTYQGGAYLWQATAAAPTATIAQTDTSPAGNAISVWGGLTLSQRAGMLGWAWKAAGLGIASCVSGAGGQLFAMQNASAPGEADIAAKFPGCGLDGPTALLYDPYPPKFKMGTDGNWVLDPSGRPVPDSADLALGNYFIDPRKATNPMEQDGGFHLRQVTLDATTPFDMDADQPSWGRFRHQPDSVALHPGGYYVAVNTAHKRLQIGRLPGMGAADGVLPLARIHAGGALDPQRHGLLFHPVAVACSYDGTILVLEDTKSDSDCPVVLARIQAFDLSGRPVDRFFDAEGRPTPFLVLSETGANTYLDLAVVGDQHMTYLYVLYYADDGSAPSDYSMAIYQYGLGAPDANPLVTTNGIAAASIAVDMWHTAYALNYDMTTDGHGRHAGPAADGGARTVPSVSEWLPPAPS